MIREISQEDISQCTNVIRESFSTVAAEFGFTEENASRFTAFATTKERLDWQLNSKHRQMYGCFEDNKIVRFILDNQECELNSLCVLPEYRHKKLGQVLLENSFDNARKARVWYY